MRMKDNEVTKETAPAVALEQVGTAILRIIKVLATAPLSEYPIQFIKLYIKYGFWRMLCTVG